jgi:hypothetical protein
MLPNLQDSLGLPAPAALGMMIYGAVSYFVTGPFIAERIATRDHLGVCMQTAADQVQRHSKNALGAATQGSPADPRLLELEAIMPFLNNPMMKSVGAINGVDLGAVAAQAKQRIEQQARQIKAGAEQTITRIHGETALRLKDVPRRCACVIGEALERTRSDFALYVGTLKLVEPAKVRNFGSVIATVDSAGICQGQPS